MRQVRPGTVIEVQTRNNTYTVIPQESGETLVWGHPEYCPEPTLIQGLGSAYVTGMIREGYVGPGLRLSFPHMGRRVSTSTILDVRVAKRQ
ncbi:MAG: hypothetical protein HYX27_21840 [Acidobacteria bacterium]|nr:hypothetical protein [Acidobacteriota bacterium]